MGTELLTHRVRAHNGDTDSANKIHDDTVARQYGFAGGLVPGVTVYAYMTRPLAEAWGRRWIEQGSMSARCLQPAYEGDDLVVTAEQSGDRADLTAATDRGQCATGWAEVTAAANAPPSIADYPVAPLPDRRHPATPEAVGSLDVLGTIEVGFHAEKAPAFLDGISDDLALYRDEGIAHPGWLLYWCNIVLARNVELGPWIHVESQATHFSALHDGERLSVRGRVARCWEAKGHELVELDLLLVADNERPVQHVDHTAIYRVRPPR
jgi:hypothetical protein